MQALWVQTAYIFFVAAALLLALMVGRRGVMGLLVGFGVIILFTRGLRAVLSYFADQAEATPLLQVLVHYARITPNTVLLVYVCMMLARRYKAARSRDWLRVWFRRAPYVHGAAYLVSLVGDLVWQAPVVEGDETIPVEAFLAEAPGYALGMVYGGAAAVVFFGAARSSGGPALLRQRLQNLFWGIAMAGSPRLSCT